MMIDDPPCVQCITMEREEAIQIMSPNTERTEYEVATPFFFTLSYHGADVEAMMYDFLLSPLSFN